MLEGLDVLVDRVGGHVLDQPIEQRPRFRVDVDLLEVGIQESVERHDGAVGRLPRWVEDVAGVGQLAALAVGDDPVELAPARVLRRVRPPDGSRRAVGGDDVHLARFDFLRRPRDRVAGFLLLAVLGYLGVPRPELDLG